MKLPDIDRAAKEPVRRQIYGQIKEQILCGLMAEGEPMPSTRTLAGELGVSRSTIVETYDMLLSEGYLVSRQGAPTIVSDGLLLNALVDAPKREKHANREQFIVDFSTGKPDLNLFPRGKWAKLLSQSAAELSSDLYGYTGPQGYAPLREEISCWLMRARGFRAEPEDIFITAGATHALHILADLLCKDGGRVLLEDPCHKGLYDALKLCGCGISPLYADDHGVRTDLLTGNEQVDLIYVTPSHQFPLGGILPAPRRAALIRYAREQDIYIVEDDYDSEFRFCGAPVAPLYALDPQRVIYVGTFSKTMFPALRLGFAILPEHLKPRWREIRTHLDVQNPLFEQAAMARFLRSGLFERHIRGMRKQYEKRRQALICALAANFGSDFIACGDAAGLHATVRFPNRRFDISFQSQCRSRGIRAVPLETHCIVKGAHEDSLVLGYGHLTPEEIESGVRSLAEIIKRASSRV